jgi:hypothetical protein
LNQDAIPNEASAVYKSRFKDSRALAWRQASAASLYILPASLSFQTNIARATGDKVVEHWDPTSADVEAVPHRGTNVYYAKPGMHRIPSEIVQKFEKALDAEYVPFYFHDMRTNEIVQFRAFLMSLTEDFTPNWETVEAYGRVDPIKIYKSTNRRINLSFRVVALDAQDFDSMWFKINKLVTLVYPQWSRGKRVKTEDGLEFSQPFSQLMSSSPLVRLRVGDLVRSNYSKFAVTRIFDLGSSSELDAAIQSGLADDLAKLQQFINQFTLTQGNFSGEVVDEIQKALDSSTIQMSIRGNTFVVRDPPEAAGPGAAIAGALAAIAGKDKKKSLPIQLSKSIKIKKIIDASEAGLVLELDDKEAEESKMKRVAVAYGPHLLVEFAPGIEKLRRKAAAPEGAEDFLDPETNPITKYFQNNVGKGLAGTIDSLNFAWLDDNTWNVHDPGSQAPKSCTVSISFTVIHDIAPGIDHAGFNRAPVYRVGKQIEAVTHAGENDDVKANPTQPKTSGKGDPLSSIPKIPGL